MLQQKYNSIGDTVTVYYCAVTVDCFSFPINCDVVLTIVHQLIMFASQEITKKAGEAWNSLSEEEKAPYYREAQVIRAKWERDLEIYKQNVSFRNIE